MSDPDITSDEQELIVDITPDERELIVTTLLNQATEIDKLADAQYSWRTKEFMELSDKTHEEAQRLRRLAEKINNV